MRAFIHTAVCVVSLLTTTPALLSAQGEEWSFTAQSAEPLSLPTRIAPASVRRALSYDAPGQPISGFLADINLDGAQDYVLRSSIDACGSNCDYLLIDGPSARAVGRVGGSAVFVTPPVINGYPVIHTYGHSSADAGYWTTYVFDGTTYMATDTIYLEGDSQRQLFESLRDIPPWPR